MANVSYADVSAVVSMILEKMAATGGLEPRRWPVSAPLRVASERIAGLLNKWNEATFNEIVADNVVQDLSIAGWRDHFVDLHARLGECHREEDLEALDRLRGSFWLECLRGRVNVTLTIAPTRPARVQMISLVPAMPLSARLHGAVEYLMTGGGRPLDEARGWWASSVDVPRMDEVLLAFRGAYGPCSLEEVIEGDGETQARVRLTCQRGGVDMVVETNSEGQLESVEFVSGRLADIFFSLDPGRRCVP